MLVELSLRTSDKIVLRTGGASEADAQHKRGVSGNDASHG
jgi:hypothetical protein